MQRLTYFETVEIETPQCRAPMTRWTSSSLVVERPAAVSRSGLGYSQVQGLILSLSVQQDNFIGSGKRLGLGISSISIIKKRERLVRQSVLDGRRRQPRFLRPATRSSTRGPQHLHLHQQRLGAGGELGIPVTEVDYLRSGPATATRS